MPAELRLTDDQRGVVEEFRLRHRTAVLALLFTDVERSTALRSQMGDVPASMIIQRHNEVIRGSVARFVEAQEVSTAGDSFFLVFSKPSDAVRFALLSQSRLRALAAEVRPDFRVRMGIHLGEVAVAEEVEGGLAHDVLGMQVDLAARVTALAVGGQILMTRAVFDNARQILKGQLLPGIGELSWVSHGPYLLKGFDEPLAICEVGEKRTAPLCTPADSNTGKRAAVPGSEPVLGWRPAVEQMVPGTEWALERQLGEGGFGEVWLARHRHTREARVFKFCFRADRLRSLKREMTLFRILKEVLGERPDIARLYDVQLEEAPYYLELEYTPGGNLGDWIGSRGGFEKVPIAQRLEIVAQIATALSAAHSVGVIHRDVKPSNVLIEERKDGSVQVRLTDFGIGQLVDREALASAGVAAAGFTGTVGAMTEVSSRSGTQLYMAPELIAGRSPSIQSDIYSLGVLFYQMLIRDFSQPMTTDWERRVGDPLLGDDLRRCLAGDPADRFGSAVSLSNRLRMLPQRRKRRRMTRLAQAAVAVLVALTVAAGAFSLLQRQMRRETEQQLYYANIALAEKSIEEHRFGRARELLAACPEPYRHWEWGRLQYLCNLDRMTLRHGDIVCAVAFTPDGKRLATAGGDEAVRLWDLQTGDETRMFNGHSALVSSVAFSPDGKRLASASWDKTVSIWDTETGKEIRRLTGHTGQVGSIAISGDGKLLATASADRLVKLWDMQTGRECGTLEGHLDGVRCVTFSPDGKRLATAGGSDRTVRLWDAETGSEQRSFQVGARLVVSVAFCPDGRVVAAGDWDGSVHFWDLDSGEPVEPPLKAHGRCVQSLAFSPDGTYLATAAQENVVKVWDMKTKSEQHALHGHAEAVAAVAFSREGKWLATASWDKTAKVWDLERDHEFVRIKGHGRRVAAVTFSQDGKRLVTGNEDGTGKLWDLETCTELVNLRAGSWDVHSLAFSPDRARIATGSWDNTAKLWNVQTNRDLLTLRGHAQRVEAVAFSPDGRRLATGSRDKTAKIWDLETGEELLTLDSHVAEVWAVAFSPDGRRLVTGGRDGVAILWDADSGEELATLRGHVGAINGFAFSADGRRLATASSDGTVKLWDTRTGQELLGLKGHTDAVWSAIFCPGGERLATGSEDESAIIWPSFPWLAAGYPGEASMPLEERTELYKRDYWKERAAAAGKVFPVSVARRIVDASGYSPQTGLPVRLELGWSAEATSLSVQESVPGGWTVEGISRGGRFEDNVVKWEIAPWTSPGVTLDYTAIPPADAGYAPVVLGEGIVRAATGWWRRIEDTPLRRGGVLTLQEGVHPAADYVGCRDSHILVFSPDFNTGACPQLEEGDWLGGKTDHKKILIRFDLSAAPTTFPLGRAQLQLHAFREMRSGDRNRHTLYAARLLRPWGEGKGRGRDGEAPQEGDATFNSAQNAKAAWEKPGILGAGDVADAESSATVGENWPEWVALDVTGSVRDFLTTPSLNHGWKLSQDPVRGVDDSALDYVLGVYMYKSSEAPEPQLRPRLLLIPSDLTSGTTTAPAP